MAGFLWRYLGEAGEELGGSESFPDRESAEEWLGEAWSGLAGSGVREVRLENEAGGQVYRMSLRPDDAGAGRAL